MTSLTISGIVSGLDTSGIVDKLVAVQGNSQTLLKNKQAAQKTAITAYSGLLTSIGSLVTQVGTLAKTSTWATTSAVSSAPSVTATATGNTASSLMFDVSAVAAAHSLISTGTVASTATTISTSGSLTLNKSDGTSSVIGVGGGSLAEVVAGINSANVGVSATAVQTSPGQYRLQIGAATTGAASQFTLSGIDVAFPMTILSTGSDASITVGGAANPQRYTVTSATNTFKGVVTGLDFTVSKLDSNVTVSSTVDPASVATQISGVVTNINNLLSTMTTNTAWDSSSKSGGPLLGDSTVRSLQQSILSTVAGMAAPGLSVTSGGQLKFDSVAFTAAFKSDPTAVANAYGATSSFTPNTGVVGTAKYTNAVATTLAGSYAVNVTTNAKAEQWQMVPPGTGFVGRILSLTRGTTTINYTGSLIDTPTTAAAAFNAKLAQAGMGVSAAADVSGNIILTAAYAGSSQAFTATIDGGGVASKLTAGADIQGSIDGVAATGIGNILTVPVTESSDAAGLSVAVTASAADITASGGAIGTIDYQPGLAQKLGTLFTQMSDSATGQLVTAQAAATAQVKDLQTAIDSWTSRLDSYRASLNQKFTAMETSLSALKAQSTAMSQFFNTGTNSSSSSS